ncbi:MAG: outer membrane protein assembly factor BamE [Candidatus Sedimenticola sp. 6PFRAG7]
MRKLLIYWVCGASLLAGCESAQKVGDAIPNALNEMPLIYRIDVQQGNVLTQETLNKLQPGMTKSQVRYLMGTPMLVDAFHQNRWDYIYSMKEGGDERDQERVALFFENDRLVRIEGDLRPQPETDPMQVEEEAVITVPDHVPQEKGIMTRVMETVGLESEEK